MKSATAELLAPAGDFETALAAFAAGADAVYCGLADFSARAFAKNLSEEDLRNLLAYARTNGKKVYVTFNTLLDEDQLDGAIETLARLEELGPDALIVQDLGVARLVRRHFPHLALHASTQLVAHNLEGVLALGELGFTRVVLARELSLAEIAAIAKRCGSMELEVFIHGALCYSLSGLCLFGAMEKGRSGNRGMCPYLCRQCVGGHYPFSMKDLRLGEDVRSLVDAGVVSLKIEGRMKSPLYVSSVTRYYRDILDGARARVTTADLETVFSRRTTELYLHGAKAESPIDTDSLGHLGTPVGVVKKVTRDREGLFWLRFHTARGLEKHDGLQFDALGDDGRHLGLGIVEMRQAISRRPVFEVNAGVDVEILVSEELARALRPGTKIYCSMSNAVKRLFPQPSFRPSAYESGTAIDLTVRLTRTAIVCRAGDVELSIPATLSPAQRPERTEEGVRKAFSKFGGTGYRLGRLTVEDPDRLFAPMSVLNDLRRDLVERLDDARASARHAKIEDARADTPTFGAASNVTPPAHAVKLRVGQKIPTGVWDEVVLAISAGDADEALAATLGETPHEKIRLALPVYTAEPDFNALRVTVKRFLRAGYEKWECADLATLRMLRAVGVTDITADWSLYAFNSQALATLAEHGVSRCVASPENGRENMQYLAESGYPVTFLVQQSTPLFISLTEPKHSQSDSFDAADLAVFPRGRLWVTTRRVPRTFTAPEGAPTRLDLSWGPIEIAGMSLWHTNEKGLRH